MPPGSAAADASPQTMTHVLVVDDSVAIRSVVAEYLRRNGFEVRTATDGRDGLRQMQEEPGIRLVLSDINMPAMDGLTMAEKIRNDLGNRDVRIVMLTTEANAQIRERARQIGVTGWIVKPFRGDAVLAPFKRMCGLA